VAAAGAHAPPDRAARRLPAVRFHGPLTTRYLEAILRRFGNGVQVRLPAPVPADGTAEYVGNGLQLGLLVVVLVAAAALAFDAQRESAAGRRHPSW
jgi:ABC-2 type transport system permease protein